MGRVALWIAGATLAAVAVAYWVVAEAPVDSPMIRWTVYAAASGTIVLIALGIGWLLRELGTKRL
jgi:hypothetical protein